MGFKKNIAELFQLGEIKDSIIGLVEAKVQLKKIEIQEKVEYFKKNKKKLQEPEVIKKRNEIKQLEKTHREMSVISEQQLDSIKTSWLDPLYKDINDEIKIYSEEKGFDYVFGNLGNGNIMYGKNTYNVTLDIIDRINVTYNKDKY